MLAWQRISVDLKRQIQVDTWASSDWFRETQIPPPPTDIGLSGGNVTEDGSRVLMS